MSITLLIIIITCAVSIYAWNNPSIQARGLFNPYQVWHRKQWGRLVFSGFLHGGWIHLIFNMFTFYFFAQYVEAYFAQLVPGLSPWLFILFYLSAIVVADLPTLWKQKDNPHYNALGASGGVSAVVFASILLNPLSDLCLYGFICLPGFIFGTLFIMYSYFQGKRMADNINHEAHLWGAIYGLIFTAVIFPFAIPRFFEQISHYSIF